MCMNTLINDLLQLFLSYKEINLRYKIVVMVCSVNITKILWNTFIEDKTAQCRGNNSCDFFSIYDTCSSDLDRSLKCDDMVLISKDCLINILEEHTFTLIARFLKCQIIDTKDHIL